MRSLTRVVLSGVIIASIAGVTACSGDDDQQATGASESPNATSSAAATPGNGDPEEASAAPSISLEPAPTTPVPAPSGGSVDEEVSTTTAAPPKPATVAPLTAEPTAAKGVKVKIDSVKAVDLEATIPGDIQGPGIAVTISVNNSSGKAVDVSNAVVNVTDSDGNPAILMQGEPTKTFSGSVASGKSAKAVYAYRIDKSRRDPVQIEVSVNPSVDVVGFKGKVSG